MPLRNLCGKHKVEMPITEQMYQVFANGKDPRDALLSLGSRALKSEVGWRPNFSAPSMEERVSTDMTEAVGL